MAWRRTWRRVGGCAAPPGLPFVVSLERAVRLELLAMEGWRVRFGVTCQIWPQANRKEALANMADRKKSYDYQDLLACAHGDLFGPGNAKLPLPPMLMFDRITEISEEGGAHGKGVVTAEFEINPDLWFFKCHFENDPVMPGCLGMDALWQLLGFFLGWGGSPGAGRALAVGEVKFMGQVLPTAKKVVYALDIKRVIRRKLVLGIADGRVICDGETIYEAKDIRVGLFQPESASETTPEAATAAGS